MKDYGLTILYHPGKANVVADTLSWKASNEMCYLLTIQEDLIKEMEILELEVYIHGTNTILPTFTVQSVLYATFETVRG